MFAVGSTAPDDGSRLRVASIWTAPLVVIFGAWLWLAFSSGGYLSRQWLPVALAVGLFGLVVALLVAYPRRPRQLSLAVLGLFGLYAVWVAASTTWAESTSRVWMEAGRTFLFLLVLALALCFLTDAGTRRAFRYLLMAAATVVLTTCIARLWASDDIVGLFIENRLSFPVSYPNNAAALFLVGFWPLMWLAAGSKERAPVRGLALGLATGLLGLAMLTQSRGAIWSLGLTVILTFIVSPVRMRTLLYLIVPALLMVYEFPNLNRYWLEGPEAVGGGLGARTVLVASITAAFIGMILALLERWVQVTRRMKAIFGTVILLGAVAGSIYGSIVLTEDVGGPFKWVSQTWRQFTAAEGTPNTAYGEASSRLTIVSSSGRVGIWKVAWKEFEGAPFLGVGADNFVFQYDRLRNTETYKPQQAHSLELQVLGETGVFGGIFAFSGMLLGLGGLLWPRCTAGWRGARETWLRRRRSSTTAQPVGANPHLCNPRWGNRSAVYGWEMAVFVGIAYWLIHASVDWLWQMAGVSIPLLLLLAAGVSEVDARVGVIWPRWNRWLRLHARPVEFEGEPSPAEESLQLDSGASGQEDGFLLIARRSDQYRSRRERREHKGVRKRQGAALLQPQGVFSLVFRALLVMLSLVVIVLVALPYLSLKYQDSAWGLARTDGVRAAQRAEAAGHLMPGDPGPYVTQATIYEDAAATAAASEAADRAGAVLDNLSLSIASYEKAIAEEPADWSLRYRAGVATLNLLLADEYTQGRNPGLDHATLVPLVPGLKDWEKLSTLRNAVPSPGAATGSLAATPQTLGTAIRYRELQRSQLGRLALEFFQAAEERNPLASEVDEGRSIVERVLEH